MANTVTLSSALANLPAASTSLATQVCVDSSNAAVRADAPLVAPYVLRGIYLTGISTSNTAAENSAAFAAGIATGGDIILPPGIVDLDGRQFNYTNIGTLSLISGGSQTRLRRTVDSVSGSWMGMSTPKMRARGIYFDGNGMGGDVWNVRAGASCLDLDLEECEFGGATGANLGYGLTLGGTQDSSGVDPSGIRRRVFNCRFHNNEKDGFWSQHSENLEVSGCDAHDNGDSGIRVDFNDTALLKQIRRGSVTNNKAHGNSDAGIVIGNPNTTNASGSSTRWGSENPDAKWITASGNNAWGNGSYGAAISGHGIIFTGNVLEHNTSAALLAIGEALDISDNYLQSSASWTVDAGRTTDSRINGNTVEGGYTGINVGASTGTVVSNNIVNGQTGNAIYGTPVETDGSGVAFQGVGENVTICGNKIGMASGVYGIRIENGFPNGSIYDNDFHVTDGSDEALARQKAVLVLGSNWNIKRNTWKSDGKWDGNIVSNSVVVPELYDDVAISGAATTITKFTTYTWDTYKDKVTWVSVTNGGTGYTSAPTVVFTGGGGSGAAATAYIDQAGIVCGIRMTNFGSGYTSAPTISFTGGGGSGAAATAQFQAYKQRRRWFVHWLNGMTLSAGAYPAFDLPAAGGVIAANRETRIRTIYQSGSNYLDY